jgi:hypothetical protein
MGGKADDANATSRVICASPCESGLRRFRKRCDLPPKLLVILLKLRNLATIVKNRIQPTDQNIAGFEMLTQPTAIQQRALDLLGVSIRP